MSLSAKSIRRLIKAHDKLHDWHSQKLAKLQQELEDVRQAEHELVATFDRLSNLAALSSLGFLRRVNALRSRATALQKAIAEGREKLARVMAAQRWLDEARLARTEGDERTETQDQLDEWVETRMLREVMNADMKRKHA